MNKTFLILLLACPGFWWVIFQPKAMIAEYLSTPKYFIGHIKSYLTSDYYLKIDEMRWGGRALHRNDIISRFFYNKFVIIPKETFDFIQFLTPRLYFSVGDGSRLTPPRLEPIPFLLFPFWIFGLIFLFKSHHFRPLYYLLLAGAFAYLVGRRNMAFLLPVLIIHTYICSLGLKNRLFTAIILVYGAYLLGMSAWLS